MRIVFFSVLCFCFNTQAAALTDIDVVNSFVPAEVLNAIDPESNPPRHLQKDQIIKKFITYDFGSKDGSKYILATYSNRGAVDENAIYKTLLIKVNKDGVASLAKAPEGYFENYGISDRSDLLLIDLDDDKINELVVTSYSPKMDFWDSKILKWTGANLKDVTPSQFHGQPGLLNQLELNALPTIAYLKIIKASGANSSSTYVQVIQKLTPKGMVDLGTFDFFKVITKTKEKLAQETFVIENRPEGAYTLVVKKLSEDSRAVRTEISVNGTVVIKPRDFCETTSGLTPKELSKNIDGDQNEDRLRGCDAKNEVSTTVSLKKTENTISVKLYGITDSKIQLTLKKK